MCVRECEREIEALIFCINIVSTEREREREKVSVRE